MVSNPRSVNDFSLPPTLVPVNVLILVTILVLAGMIFAILGVIDSYWMLFETTTPDWPPWIFLLKYRSFYLSNPIFLLSKSVSLMSTLMK